MMDKSEPGTPGLRSAAPALPPCPAPDALSLPADRILSTSFRLRARLGSLDPRTEAWFEFGIDPALRTPLATPPRALRAGVREAVFAETVFGAVPGTTYFYRVVARCGDIVRRGPVLRVTTPRETQASSAA